jgi:hypothetical protein
MALKRFVEKELEIKKRGTDQKSEKSSRTWEKKSGKSDG